jgi:hypothetical protein
MGAFVNMSCQALVAAGENGETWCTDKKGRIRVGVAATGRAPPGRLSANAGGLTFRKSIAW